MIEYVRLRQLVLGYLDHQRFSQRVIFLGKGIAVKETEVIKNERIILIGDSPVHRIVDSLREKRIGAYQSPYYEGGDQPAGYVPCYVAEFMDQDVGYRVRSENLTQQEFIDVLHSLPVFQES